MTLATIRPLGRLIVSVAIATVLMGLLWIALWRFLPRNDPLPAQLARTDERAANSAAQAVGAQVERQQRDATINIDLTTKEIRDAFDAIPAVPVPTPGAEPRALPAAPVDRVRDRLNESIARANRSAGDAGAAD